MIDLIYKVLLTIINKENNGYVSPEEFNLLMTNVQMEIFRSYFEDENHDKNRQNRGLVNSGYGNLPYNQRHLITQFSEFESLGKTDDRFILPSNLYFIEQDGITTTKGVVIEEVERHAISYVSKSIAAPSPTYPVYESYGDAVKVYPDDMDKINVRYIRTPKTPRWTYMVVQGKEMFNPAHPDFQDIELHDSEMSNIVNRMISYFGLNLREGEVIEIAERLKDKLNVKDNG